jgi:hypothetical protein
MVVSSDKEMASLTAGDQTVTLLIRGQAKVIGNKLVFKDTLSAPQRATVLAAFKAKSILNSTAI